MKLQIIFLSFLTIINSTFNKASEKTDNLLKILEKEHWTLSVNTSPFKTNTLAVEDSSDPSNIIKQTYPLCSEEEAKTIETSLNVSFGNLPTAYPDCLRLILTGKIEDELLRLTPSLVTIQDKKEKRYSFSHLRNENSSFTRK